MPRQNRFPKRHYPHITFISLSSFDICTAALWQPQSTRDPLCLRISTWCRFLRDAWPLVTASSQKESTVKSNKMNQIQVRKDEHYKHQLERKLDAALFERRSLKCSSQVQPDKRFGYFALCLYRRFFAFFLSWSFSASCRPLRRGAVRGVVGHPSTRVSTLAPPLHGLRGPCPAPLAPCPALGATPLAIAPGDREDRGPMACPALVASDAAAAAVAERSARVPRSGRVRCAGWAEKSERGLVPTELRPPPAQQQVWVRGRSWRLVRAPPTQCVAAETS